MTDSNRGPAEGRKGVVEGITGKVKETVGAAVDNDSLKREGEAQQDKADTQRDASKNEAEAARATAGFHEARERRVELTRQSSRRQRFSASWCGTMQMLATWTAPLSRFVESRFFRASG
jgi:uncharacterized protein YjbJ (UPF0337 family)